MRINKNMYEILKKNKELWSIYCNEEEYNYLLLDKYDRFTYNFSRNRNIFEPEVSKFLINNAARTFTSPRTAPTERSIPAVRITIVIPTLIIAIKETCFITVNILYTDKKFGVAKERIVHNTKKAINIPNSVLLKADFKSIF